jgi:chromate transporter
MIDKPIWQLAAHLALVSVLAIGGINVALPDVHRFVVDLHGWLTDQEFTDMFAIAQAAPGPNMLIFALIGWKVDGLAGACAATLAVIAPCGAVAYALNRPWQHFRTATWRRAVQFGIAPITVGLIFSTGYVLSSAADRNAVTFAITVATAVVTLATRINPLWLFAVAGLLGILGFT